MTKVKVNVKGKEYKVEIEELEKDSFKLRIKNKDYFVDRTKAITIRAPMPGVISSVEVRADQKVKKGQTLIKLIAMKMENEISAKKDCRIKKILVEPKVKVEKGDPLIEVE